MIIGQVTSELSAPLLKALEFFPELSGKRIMIYESSFFGVQHTSRAYPPVINFFGKKSNWIYVVAVNKRRRIWKFFQSLSFEQKVGLFAHELSHLSYYSRRSRCGLIFFSLAYAFSKKFVRKIEKETDFYVVAKGAGKYLFGERITLCHFWESHPYPETEDTYIHPRELLAEMKKYPDFYPFQDLPIYTDALATVNREPQRPGGYFKGISVRRKFKHSLRTIVAFFPELIKLFRAVKKNKK